MKNDKLSRATRIVLILFGLVCNPETCAAHPMGNFSINHYAKIRIERTTIEIRYLIDMAEIPTFQDMRQFDIAPAAENAGTLRYLDKQEELLKKGIAVESDGHPVRLDTISRHVAFADGAGGLRTMKIGFVFRGKPDVTAAPQKLSYQDNNFPGRAGWKEVVVLGDGIAILDNSASGVDRSQELTNYSSDILNSPPQQLSALVTFRTLPSAPGRIVSTRPIGDPYGHPIPHGTNAAIRAPSSSITPPHSSQQQATPTGGEAAVTTPRLSASGGQNTPRNRFTQLVSARDKFSFWFLLSAALIATGLGALHALEPGHGKTLVAAYLVGSRGTASHAVLLGIVVTVAHTAGVYLLGAATLYASRYIVPEQLYPWLGSISGLSVAGLGIFIFLRQWTGETGAHSHAPGEQHSHGFLSMFRQPSAEREANLPDSKVVERKLSLRELCMLGIMGGIVPCPAALVVLLSAFSLHRIGFGLFLITAFSFGLAAVLVIVGLTIVYAKRAVSSRVRVGNTALRFLPFLSSALVVVLGVGMTISSLASVPMWRGLVATDKLVPFVTVVLLGLFLGMRHSTDPDHVVAVSTIISRQGSVASSATIGLLWGLGHTVTIFLVGSAIIVFGVVIPPRLGLSMEFCVALMLILLGVLNLTGVMGWVTRLTTPGSAVSADPEQRTSSRVARFRYLIIGKIGVYQTIRPIAVGLVHGLAGSAAVALLVLSTIKSPLWSTAYLLVFGFGTMAGMTLMTAAISMPLVYTGKRFLKIDRYMITISGLASMAFGMFLVYQIGFVDGLFTSHTHWVPQ